MAGSRLLLTGFCDGGMTEWTMVDGRTRSPENKQKVKPFKKKNVWERRERVRK